MLALLLVIGIILLVVWLLGLLLDFIAGPILWVLLVIGAILVLVWLFRAFSRRV